jgi:hypothetical protein
MVKDEFTREELDRRSISLDPYSKIDFTAVKDGSELLALLKDDGLVWATAFKQYVKKYFNTDIDLNFAHGWFCNAIESTTVYRNRDNQEKDKE